MRAVETRRWTREEFSRLAVEGFFRPDERLELIDGVILSVTPQGSPHATAIHLAAKALSAAFGSGHYVRVQVPLALDRFSEPEPDVAVVIGTERDYARAHPTEALLVVEVSEATLEYDRKRKGSLYARSGIPEYWIVNLVDRRLEVHHNPTRSWSGRHRGEYRSVTHHVAGESVIPVHATLARIEVDELFP
jgi:Uma2 family endonuclease